MSLSTFNDLKLEIIDFSHRDDIDQKVDTFIELAEQEMFANPDEVLRVRGQETRLETVTAGQFLSLPADFQSMRSVKLVTGSGDCELKFRAPAQIRLQPDTGQPSFFTVTDRIEFERVPDSNYDIVLQYFAIPAPLTTANQTNEILDNFPGIYLYGALKQVFLWAVDTEEAPKYHTLFIAAIKGANKKDKQGRYGPAPAMTPPGATP